MARVRGIKRPHPLGSVPSRRGVPHQLTAESGITTSGLPGVKISGLPAAGAATETDQLEVNQGGISRRLTVDQLLDALPPPPSADWDSITDKPATFPPTIPTGPAIATWPYLPLTGGTLTGALTGTTATMSGNITSTAGSLYTTGGSVILDRTGDAATAYTYYVTDAGQASGSLMRTGANLRWSVLKTASAEGGSNSGSDFSIVAYTDAGGTLSTPLTITRSTGAVTLTGALTGTTAAFSGAVTSVTAAPGTNTTQLASTAFVTAALAGGGASISVGTTPPGSPAANALWWNTDASVGGGQMYIYYDSFWVPASPGIGSGAVVQTVSFQTGAVATGTTTIPVDDTIPQISEGTEFMTLAITPRSATSKLVVNVTCMLANSITTDLIVALFIDAAANALAVSTLYPAIANAIFPFSFQHTMTSGTTSAIVFRVRAGPGAASTTTINGVSGARRFGGALASSIVIQEVL